MNYDFLFKRLKDIREDNELTQDKLSKILNTTQSNYSRWENNTKIIPLKNLNNFCNYFNISMDYVSGLNNKKKYLNENYTINKNIAAKRLKELRLKKNLTQKDLANILNTTQSTICAYEQGKTLILTSFAYQLCAKYNVSLDWLCGREKK